jgi:hypothetical protein
VIIARSVIADAESNRLEGLMLIGVYLMLGFGFFHSRQTHTEPAPAPLLAPGFCGRWRPREP